MTRERSAHTATIKLNLRGSGAEQSDPEHRAQKGHDKGRPDTVRSSGTFDEATWVGSRIRSSE